MKVQEKQFQDSKIPKGYKQTEIGVIPEDWVVRKLGDVVDGISGGGTPSRSNPTYWGNGIPWVTVKDFATYNPNSSQESITYHGLKNSASKLIPKGTIITGTRMSLGKAVIYNVDVAINQDLKAIYLKSNINTNFILHWFSLNERFIDDLGSGSTVKGLSTTDLKNLTIPLPPTLIEQEKIAEVLSDTDAYIEKLESILQKKKWIKQGAMQELLTGKTRLVGKSNKTEARKRNLKSTDVPVGYKMTEVGVITEDWVVRKLGDVGETIIGLTYSPSNISESGILVLRSSNINNNRLKFDDNVFVDVLVNEKLILKENDILVCVRNGSRELIGKCSLIKGRAINQTFGAFMSIFRCPINRYIINLFQSKIIKTQINEYLGATINQITNKSLNSFIIPFPPTLEEQEKIAEVLSNMDAEIEKMEAKIEKYKYIKKGMMQKLLTGQLRLV